LIYSWHWFTVPIIKPTKTGINNGGSMRVNKYLNKGTSEYPETMVLGLASIIDGLVAVLTLGRYQTRFRRAVLFCADDTAIGMLKQMLKGCDDDF